VTWQRDSRCDQLGRPNPRWHIMFCQCCYVTPPDQSGSHPGTFETGCREGSSGSSTIARNDTIRDYGQFDNGSLADAFERIGYPIIEPQRTPPPRLRLLLGGPNVR
jgi:hypothetical protein